MEHQLITGEGGKYLPLARNLIRKLRATGLHAASNHVVVNGFKIQVRIFADQDFIRISGGGWLAYPVAVDLRTSLIHVKPTVDVTRRTPTSPPTPPNPGDYAFTPEPVPAIEPTGYSRTFSATHELPPPIGAPGTVFQTSTFYHGYMKVPAEAIPILDSKSDAEMFSGSYTWNILYFSHDDYILDTHPGGGGDYWRSLGTTSGSLPDGYDEDAVVVATGTQQVIHTDSVIAHDEAVDRNNAGAAAAAAAYAEALAEYEVAYAAWQSSESAANAADLAAIAARIAAARISARPGQVARLYEEVDKGVNAPWISYGTLPPPITPRVKHVLPFPVAVQSLTFDPLTDDDTAVFRITDYSVDPPTTRSVTGTRRNQTTAGEAGSCGNTFNRSVVESMLVAQSVVDAGVHQPFGRKYIVNPNMSFGYLATGFTQQLEGGVQTAATFTTPPEYLAYLRTSMESADVDDVIESDAYVRPNAKLLLVHLEWETYDSFLDIWTWVPTPYVLRVDPVYFCGGDGSQELELTSVVRAVRLRKITKQTLSAEWVWSAPTDVVLDPTPEFARDVVATGNESASRFPAAVAILSNLPSVTLPPKKGGALAEASIYLTRLSSDSDLRHILNTEWDGDHTSDSWMDRLVMETLSLSKTYSTETP